MTTEIRQPAVQGRFYPADERELAASLRTFLGPAFPESPAIGVVVPHAGYMYSGAIAGQTYARVRVPPRVIVLCPNHTGRGLPRAVSAADSWLLPGGPVPVDRALTNRLVHDVGLSLDSRAHASEHAIEVQLPFLRAKNPRVAVAGVCLSRLSFDECLVIGRSLAAVVASESRGPAGDVMIVASSDMSHYIHADDARRLDSLALERILDLDAEGLHRVVLEARISMCGYVPVTIALVVARELGGRRAELVRYGNSGDVSGDFEQVVGYAGVVLS